ncbi:MAG: tripartite tricarboxylate transporter substrate-binding protein [Xanthobacteraceae bacterium]|jgi:tripartite-type tricarboxylate transporter receptor subunit TctC
MKRRDFLRGTACALPTAFVAFASRYAAAEAEQFPAHYMTLVVPFGAGGPPDVIARIVAAKLGDVLGKPVIVDNRPGASSSLAATDVARSPADGYTLLLADMSFVVAPHLFTNMRANPLTDFAPVGLSAKSQFALMVSPNLDTPTVADFIKLAKAKGEGVTIGHSGIGTTPHLAAITFTKAAGINPLLISYRAITQAADDVLAGQISGYFSAAAQGIGLAKSGKVRVLGVTGAARLRELPDVPTFSESGITMKGFEDGSWYGIVAPAKTPEDVVTKLNTALKSLADAKETKDALAAIGAQLNVGTPEEFATFIKSQYAYWGETLQTAGVKPQ